MDANITPSPLTMPADFDGLAEPSQRSKGSEAMAGVAEHCTMVDGMAALEAIISARYPGH
jgi:hypothetical protein